MKPAVSLPPLAVILMFPDAAPADMSGLQKFVYRLALAAIKKYQSWKYPGGRDLDATHAMAVLRDGELHNIPTARVLDVTWPRALIHFFEFGLGKKYKVYIPEVARVCENLRRGSADQQAIWWAVMDAVEGAANKLHGTRYDDLQLFGIGFQPILGGILKKYLPPPFNSALGEPLSHSLLLGWGKTRAVCSTGTHALLLVAYKVLKQHGIECARPLGDQWVEETSPAAFANSPDCVEYLL